MLFRKENIISFAEYSTDELKTKVDMKKEQLTIARENFEFEYVRLLEGDIQELREELVRRRKSGHHKQVISNG